MTYLAIPDRFIFFGILHAIALSSVFGLPFVFLPGWIALAGGMAVMVLDARVVSLPFTSTWLAWTGLSSKVPPSLDFIPMMPWFAPFLLGMAFAKLMRLHFREPRWSTALPAPVLAWPGRHSLSIYLLHQPVLMAVLWCYTQL